MGYSLGYFSDFGSFFKMAITREIEVVISSNFLHSISTCTSICITKCIKKIEVISQPFFGKKTMGYSLEYFLDFGSFFKMAITQKIEVGISSSFLQSISTSICIRKCNKNLR